MSIFEERYRKLNIEQKKAVDQVEGPVMVIAGPGSGKTELLSMRAANILRLTDASPSDILCLTFTDAAAHNMRERLAGLIGKDAYKIAIHTFHSFGSEIINHHPEYFYNGAIYSPADDITKIEILEKIIEDLSWDSKLKSYHPSQGYTYLSSIKNRIEDLKKGGLDPEEFEYLIMENEAFEEKANIFFSEAFEERISIKTVNLMISLIEKISLIEISDRKKENSRYKTEKDVILESLKELLEEVDAVDDKKSKTKPITAWKKRFLKKNSDGKWVLSSSFRNKELLDVSRIYKKYQEEMHSRGLYDFSDMILDTVNALEKNREMRFEIQEKFLYVMVDEFQDTNGAQMRLLDLIVNKEVNEGSPNILVVGDDDQSIYKFQGANVQNVTDFLKRYRDVKKITLIKNYRSTQNILDYSNTVICQSRDRLEQKYPDIVKDLICENPNIKDGKIVQKEFSQKIEQYIFIADEVRKNIEKNPENEIAIIARGHKELEEISKVFNFFSIPVNYERSKNVLESRHIIEIITIMRFIDSLNRKDKKQSDELLPEILSFEFFEIERLDIWKISSMAYRNRKNWLEVMIEFGGKPKEVGNFLIALGAESKRKTVEQILDFITGIDKIKDVEYQSNFKNYYFSKEKFDNSRMEYIEHLFDLQSLFGKFREYKNKEVLYVRDFVEFIELYENHKLSIYESRKISKGKKSVNLITAHKAKGLEFDSVFIVNCNEETWMKNHGKEKLPLPINIPLTSEKDNIDDRIRLFFVAVTRAKSNLYLTNYKNKDDKRFAERLRFLDADIFTDEIERIEEEAKPENEIIEIKEKIRYYRIDNFDEEELLRSILEDYKLSATHLNNFLDVTKGGPSSFLERNLLRFPEAQNSASSYGTAIHGSFNEFYKRFKEKGRCPEIEEFLDIFEKKLKMQRLSEKDFLQKLEKGRNELELYFKENENRFCIDDALAVNFKSEGVIVGDAKITGEIDRMSFDLESKIINVFDYKTGKPFSKWNPTDMYLKIKSSKYKDQLIFYKILIENSRNFDKYKVGSGFIEFITQENGKLINLELSISEEEVQRVKSLIEIIYNKIMNLDFPDINKYSKDAEGIRAFEADLLSGKI